jgi:hypothetical protein
VDAGTPPARTVGPVARRGKAWLRCRPATTPALAPACRGDYDRHRMLHPGLQRFTAWLCLLASQWMGVAPARELVLCVEPGGGISLEAAVDGRCSGCLGECCSGPEIAAVPCGSDSTECAHGRCAGPARAGDEVREHEGNGPCLDIALPSTDDERIGLKSPRPVVEEPTALLPAGGAPRLLLPSRPTRPDVIPSGRPPPSHAFLRSVVLLI